MASRKSGQKRKKGVTFHEVPESVPSTSSQAAPKGYLESYMESFRREGVCVTTTSTIQIPPSPVKVKTSVKNNNAENVAGPSFGPTFHDHSSGNSGDSNPQIYDESPYDTLWQGDDESSAENKGWSNYAVQNARSPAWNATTGAATVRYLLSGAKDALYEHTRHVLRTGLSLGLRIQLGHEHGETCSNPRPAINNEFVIIDSDGIHCVALDFCGCERTQPAAVQLLRARLFPATLTDPHTAASFRVLETFQMLSFTARTSAYKFLAAIRRRTNNCCQDKVPDKDRYWEFMRMIHEWRHLRLLKRKGRGTQPGECVVLCPACPLPDINLPDDWNRSDELWLYALFLAVDANFRLTCKVVSDDIKDPGLNHGYAYIVEEQAFKQYLLTFGDLIPNDKSTCNNHDAIKSASIRGGKGFAASGLGTVQCSRHDMKRPNGSGDVQKGERYVSG
ncbi:hypothetical protein H1R20_g10072, partial [Candolleomyces eurysporus]